MSLRERWRAHQKAVAERRLQEPVGLTVVPTEPEAEMTCSLLRSNGIKCYYRKTDMGGALTQYTEGSTIGPFEVLVLPDDLDLARELVKPAG